MKKVKKTETSENKPLVKASVHDFDLILRPIITEKTMKLMQEKNKVTIRVKKNANRAEVKQAFERVFGVSVADVNISRVESKKTRRGGRYNGYISGYKKAIVTVKGGEAIDLFKE